MVGQPKKRQRKRKTTKAQAEVRAEIIANLKEGMTVEAAVLLAGITTSTYYRWLESDEKFSEEIAQAHRYFEAIAIARIKQAATDRMDWKAWAWMLEKRYPDDYGKRQELQVTTESSSDGTAEVLSMMEQIKSLRNTTDSTDEDGAGGST